MPQTGDLLGAAEASQLLGISRNTLIRRVDEGQIPALGKLSGKNGALVFRRSDLEALLQPSPAAPADSTAVSA